MTSVSPLLEEDHEDDAEDDHEAAPEDTDERDGSARSLDEIIDAYAG